MTVEVFADAFGTTLNGGINNAVTSVTLTSVTGIPAADPGVSPPTVFRAVIDGDIPNVNAEIVWVTDATSNPVTVTWAAETYPGGCAAGFPAAHLTGVPFRAICTADTFGRFVQQSEAGCLAPVVLVSGYATEVTSSPPSGAATVDGVAVVTGNRVLLTAQTVGTDCGIWIANTAGTWTRAADWAAGAVIPNGTLIPVGGNGNWLYSSVFQTLIPITVGTTSVFGGEIAYFTGAALNFTALPTSTGLPIAQFLGGFGTNWTDTTGAYAMTGAESVLFADGAITLPPPTTPFENSYFTIKDTGAGTSSVLPHGAETIDGHASISLTAYEAVTVMSNGTNWFVISQVASTVL